MLRSFVRLPIDPARRARFDSVGGRRALRFARPPAHPPPAPRSPSRAIKTGSVYKYARRAAAIVGEWPADSESDPPPSPTPNSAAELRSRLRIRPSHLLPSPSDLVYVKSSGNMLSTSPEAQFMMCLTPRYLSSSLLTAEQIQGGTTTEQRKGVSDGGSGAEAKWWRFVCVRRQCPSHVSTDRHLPIP